MLKPLVILFATKLYGRINIYKYDWNMFEKNNLKIALNILYTKEKETFPAYIFAEL